MSYSIPKLKWRGREKGIATLEFALILPILVIMVFGVIDLGGLIHARLIITNVSREGGSLASRDIKAGSDLLTMLMSSGTPLDLNTSGRIYISKISEGVSADAPNPVISTQINQGNLAVNSAIRTSQPYLGLTADLFNHLVFKPANQTADISGVTVVEVFYIYRPITPLPNFIQNFLLDNGAGKIIGSRAVF
jgi:Flp pilus assembly protein TadG